jgi:uncharacterized OsmC-like protein
VQHIGSAIERLGAAVERRPGLGLRTYRSVTTSTDGLRCCTEEGDWRTVTDLPAGLGGDASAPSPGVLLRAALGSCMAMSYRLRAARHGVELTAVRVTVDADSDTAGMLSCDASAPPGYTEIRYHVEVDSPAPADDVMQILDEGDRLSPLLDVVARTNSVRRTTSIRTDGA